MNTISLELQHNYPGQNTAKIIANLREFYLSFVRLTKSVSKVNWNRVLLAILGVIVVIVGAVIVILAIPVLLALTILFYRKVARTTVELVEERTALENRISQLTYGELEVMDLSDYKIYKGNQWLSNELKALSDELDQSKSEMKPLARRLLKPLQRFISEYFAFSQSLRKLMDFYESASPKGNLFQTHSEEELWQRRNSAYEYLV
jgi:ABC-type transport system involved in cytochrome bd biosynthesis fused ATPase/permease subunit